MTVEHVRGEEAVDAEVETNAFIVQAVLSVLGGSQSLPLTTHSWWMAPSPTSARATGTTRTNTRIGRVLGFLKKREFWPKGFDLNRLVP